MAYKLNIAFYKQKDSSIYNYALTNIAICIPKVLPLKIKQYVMYHQLTLKVRKNVAY